MTAKVATIDIGSARLGMTVAETLRRKRKITSTTRHRLSHSVNLTSATESRIETERSNRIWTFTAAGIWAWKLGSRRLMASTTSTVLVPGWRWMARAIERLPLNQLATLSFSTP